jgi:hypothetical protein
LIIITTIVVQIYEKAAGGGEGKKIGKAQLFASTFTFAFTL